MPWWPKRAWDLLLLLLSLQTTSSSKVSSSRGSTAATMVVRWEVQQRWMLTTKRGHNLWLQHSRSTSSSKAVLRGCPQHEQQLVGMQLAREQLQ